MIMIKSSASAAGESEGLCTVRSGCKHLRWLIELNPHLQAIVEKRSVVFEDEDSFIDTW